LLTKLDNTQTDSQTKPNT